jgi:osomolarity two-component system, sensor histidine kinase SLN1
VLWQDDFFKSSLNVTQAARRAAYNALGEGPETIDGHLKAQPDCAGIVVGDETRLRQIVTNLARYAYFFVLAAFLTRISQ